MYQDITINTDGSITIKEAALLSGEYNGRSREIKFKNPNSNTFTGIYSNFAGNTDIYNGTSIKDIKIYDISQSNFNIIDDMNKSEKIYKQVNSASNGKYGVYTVSSYSYESDFKIYCPSKKKKIICMEYTITDAIVVHNDIAELYWNVLGNNYREAIGDFKVLVHLPGEDNDLRVWTHGPLSGRNEILNSKTVYFEDKDISKYTPETIRIMFNKSLVPNATKLSNVNGKAHILEYEKEMADAANYERENEKLEKTNKAVQYVIDLEEYPTIYWYNSAIEYLKYVEDDKLKNELKARIENQKEEVNQSWKKSIEYEINRLERDNYNHLSRYNIKQLQTKIAEGFDEEAKTQYQQKVELLTIKLEQKEKNTRDICIIISAILYSILSIITLYKLLKIFFEKRKTKINYYRDFPSNINPYSIEYLMKRKITNLSISATILNLITKKVISINKNDNTKDIKLILENGKNASAGPESIILHILFEMVGNNGECSLNNLKNYGKNEYKARKLQTQISTFKKEAKKEAEIYHYFKSNTSIVINIIFGIVFSILLFMNIGIFNNVDNSMMILIYNLVILASWLIFSIIISKDKNRTEAGKIEYSKWLAHKRFLKHFSMLDEKDLPEIQLWEKYLVTATVLGCADKVEKRMRLYINDYDISDYSLLLATSMSTNLVKTISDNINTSINTANVSSSSSSGGGYGGGSSGGGGRSEDGGGGGGRF